MGGYGKQMDFQPIVKSTSAQQVARQLLDMIRRGVWQPGDRLPPERQLIEKLAVGRSTVREALQILATLNVVQSTAGQGTFVKEPRTDEILRSDVVGLLINNAVALELLEAREMIEPNAVRLACLRGTEAEFERIERLLDEHEAALKANLSTVELAREFHVMLAGASHNNVAATLLRSILVLTDERQQRALGDPDFKYRELEEHRHIFRLVQARNVQAAADYLLQHIIDSAAVYRLGYEREREKDAS
jgi:DNA-binding FadR family transcriptional regulator